MRELKFRIWDNDKNEWLAESDDDALTYYGFHLIGEVMTVQSPRKWIVNGVVEQYTGLNDKNDREIYEGDIVRIDSMDELRVGYVDLVNDQYCIVCGEDDEGYKIVAEFYYYSKPEENCEVIGNIHENPELLEEE